ncbi:MAG: S9 family peptidase [Bacteroidota bacterium]|nr:S9 family peptidase [Candidatus Kapabacteria bacterium]MCS7303304.1 S9 family peptidase [Candidatus Kapabacteria bacterium]MCX7936965.1 S9 family peptidase [Chlorobiota bacterium]MDW8075606.1 S9 family peptidase [Bacteroidota bacterium]MDW8272109.1 S9 family peptidase [Bacteroidota bacterium]
MAIRCIPAEELFRNPSIAQVRLSPDGALLAWLAPHNGHLNICVRDRVTGEERFVTDERQRSIHAFAWANATTIAFLRDTNGDENYQLYLLDVRSGEPARLCTPAGGVRAGILSVLPWREDRILITHNGRNRELFDVYALDVSTGMLECVAENPGGVISWLADDEGAVRAAVRSDGANTTILYRSTPAEEFRELLTTNFRTTLQPLRFTADGRRLYVLSNRGRDTAAVYVFDPETLREEELVAASDTYDLEGILYSYRSKRAVAASFVSWKQEYIFCDPRWQALWERFAFQLHHRHGSDIVVALTDWSREEDWFIVAAYGDVHPASYYLGNAATGELTFLGNAMPHLRSDELAPMQPIQYRSRDGELIRGYLTLPREHTKPVPLVVFPHGGPWTRDVWGFNPAVQLFANRGYGVLQMNYRGSTGYGRRFWEASFKQWGRAMQDDITDGVRWLIANGVADPERVGIVGGSYGGYAVLAGLAFTPELYRCGVDIVGVSNLLTFRKTIPPYWRPLNQMLDEMIGNPETEEELLRQVSPVFHASNICAPLLVFQGANDPRVNKAESDQIVEALRTRNIPVEYYVRDDEGHGFLDERNRVWMYGIIERFLATHLGGRICNGDASTAGTASA